MPPLSRASPGWLPHRCARAHALRAAGGAPTLIPSGATHQTLLHLIHLDRAILFTGPPLCLCYVNGMRRQLLRVLASALGSSALVACGGDDIRVGQERPRTLEPSSSSSSTSQWPSPIDDIFDDTVCTNGQMKFLVDLNPAEPADYVAIRTYHQTEEPWVTEEIGECNGTADCENIPAPEGQGFPVADVGASHLVVIHGEVTKFLLTVNEVKEFLGTIDTPTEAALFAYASGYRIPPCNQPNLHVQDDGYSLYTTSGSDCGAGQTLKAHQIFVSAKGTIDIVASEIIAEGNPNCAIGRLPSGLRETRVSEPRATQTKEVGHELARIAFLEAAAVAAFQHLATELEALGAPVTLVERAKRAAREETRHAILMRALARRWGCEPDVPVVETRPLRSAFDLALDNAVEGLARERFGALLALHQAHCAQDPMVRSIMAVISDDEVGHAEFSAELHAWLWPQLTAAQQAEVRNVHLQAIARFRAFAIEQPCPDAVTLLGMPDSHRALALLDALFRDVPPNLV